MSKIVSPELGGKSFSCPHCAALAHQTWFKVFTTRYDEGSEPWIPDSERVAHIEKAHPEDRVVIDFFRRWANKEVFLEKHDQSSYLNVEAVNIYVSRCFSCNRIAIWVADALLYPSIRYGVEPSEDMPEDVRADFLEAASIVEFSPRGAAALLRLALQKLLVSLGEKGKNLDSDIGALVKKGLDPRIQRALDVVRVVGNNAVHPGQIDLKDDKATAQRLFEIVNAIVISIITAAKKIDALYSELPEGALAAIEKRDGAAAPLEETSG